ncbi:MAG: TldD/PmbA family protein [Bacilli bacterium]|jgi:PmbA protein
MNVKKFFELANEANVNESEVVIEKTKNLSIGVYQEQIENFTISTSFGIRARGIYNGKMGFAESEKDDKTTPAYLVDEIKVGATVSESDEPAIIFKGSEKYKRRNLFNKDIINLSERTKIDNLFLIERKLKAFDPRIVDVMVDYAEYTEDSKMHNSYGLKLSKKQSYYYYAAQIVVKEGEETKTGFDVFLSDKVEEFDIDKFVEKVAQDGLNRLGGKPCKSGVYKTILNEKVTASLLRFYLINANAENVQKNSSLFIGKLNEQIASSKVTILDAPLTKNVFYSYYDDEGVAKYNKPIIEKGVLKTYLYNLSTAAKDGVTSTGNAVASNGKISIAPSQVVLKPGRKTLEELMLDVKDGIYLTEVTGLHAGMNPTSGDFSLQANGFIIKDGKIDSPLNLITVAGNLVDLFENVTSVGKDQELQLSGYTTSPIVVKNLAISGE